MTGGQPSFWSDYTEDQITDDATGGPVGRDHPDTSKRAATKVRSGSQRYKVLQSLYDLGDQTAFELAQRVTHDDGRAIAANQIATRLGELRDLGLVVLVLGRELHERGWVGWVHLGIKVCPFHVDPTDLGPGRRLG